jgi:hypothetical protein
VYDESKEVSIICRETKVQLRKLAGLVGSLLFIGVSVPLYSPAASVLSTAWQQATGVTAAAPAAWQAASSCKIYILDLSAEVAPVIGVPQCDIHDPEVRLRLLLEAPNDGCPICTSTAQHLAAAV